MQNPKSSTGNTVRNRKKGTRMTLSEAGRLLRKRISVSRQLLAAGQVWRNSVPSAGCDVVVTFPPSTTEETLVWLLTQLRSNVPELSVEVRHHTHTNVYGFYLTTSYENLLKGAEEERLRKPLKPQFGGGMREFVFEERECFSAWEQREAFLSSQERQSITLNMLHGLRAAQGDQLQHIKFVEGQPIVPKCLAEGVISQVLPLHNSEDLNKLKRTWMQAVFKVQPLNDICDYFGVKIAIYFAWLGHYTKALTLPAFFGLFMWLCYYGRDQATEDICFVVFALFNVLWATLYLEAWKRNCAELAYRWGTLDIQNELLAEPRPLFTGPLAVSPITGRMEPTYPAWKRNLFRYCVSLPVIAFCLLVVFLVMFLIFELQTWWDRMIEARGFPFWMTLFPKVLLALVINVLDGVYHRIAVWLNDKENYRGEEEYENHLVAKELLFQFVNSFLSLFYIAFYLQDMEKLKEQLAALLITRQVVGNIKESLIPFLTETLKLAHLSGGAGGRDSGDSSPGSSPDRAPRTPHLTQAEVESAMYKYEGTFEDYLEMFIQFGYVILFSSAFPMAAMCALLNNVIEIRSDAFKLCMIFQRPFGQRAENIGTWQDAMEVMGVIAVIVNCALIGISGQVQRMFPNLSTQGTILLIIVLEHLILSLKFGIAYAIPDVPQWVASKMAKVEFQRREAVKHFHRSSLSKKKKKMEFRANSFDTSTPPPKHPKKGQKTTTTRSCQTTDSSPSAQNSFEDHSPEISLSSVPQKDLQRGSSVEENSSSYRDSPAARPHPRYSDSPVGRNLKRGSSNEEERNHCRGSPLAQPSPSYETLGVTQRRISSNKEEVPKSQTYHPNNSHLGRVSQICRNVHQGSSHREELPRSQKSSSLGSESPIGRNLHQEEGLHKGSPLAHPSHEGGPKLKRCDALLEDFPTPLEVIPKDMDAMSINFETPYSRAPPPGRRVQRKLSLPQIKLLRKNSSQESEESTEAAAANRRGRFMLSLKKRKHALKRALSFQNSTSSEDKPTKDEPTTV